MPRVIIVDYGVGNLRSLALALGRLGADVAVSADSRAVARADRLIFPGVGAFDAAMERLAEPSLASSLHEQVFERQTPVLGICLGLQLMSRSSPEGQRPGLGWIAASTRRLAERPGSGRRVPHLGWAMLCPVRPDTLFSNPLLSAEYYFAHSYVVDCQDPQCVVATAHYGECFPAVVRQGHLTGLQFHPERSHRAGQQLLSRFLEGN